MTVAIVDNGGANINSLVFALQRLDQEPLLSSDYRDLDSATHIILPGVGHARDSMSRLAGHGLSDFLCQTSKPVLGICLGMQLFYQYSDEGDTECLGIVDGTVTRIPAQTERPSPHMGWNQIDFDDQHDVLAGIASGSYLYFVHSYAAPVNDFSLATTEYGERFTSITVKNNFIGVQFHPERSGNTGAQLLANFLDLS